MTDIVDEHREEVLRGNRFEFGANWTRFLRSLNDRRIALATDSLRDMLEVPDLNGRTFLDVGSGSGLFSLAARRLGAAVRSFDYDPQSVACTAELRRRYFDRDPQWRVERGSVLDVEYLRGLGEFDVVYSWGVLHHTGAMWQALENVKPLVRSRGKLFIAIYNDLGAVTDRWARVKQRYNALPGLLKLPYALRIIAGEEWWPLASALRRGKPQVWIKRWLEYDQLSRRGMSQWHDWIDWIGGHPYERATIEQIVDFYADDGFRLTRLFDCSNGYGCNEFVFHRERNLGEPVDVRLPGGTSPVRRFGHRVRGQIETGARTQVGRVVLPAGERKERFLLMSRDRLFGLASVDDSGAVWLESGASPGDKDILYLVDGTLFDTPAGMRHERGRMWSIPLPRMRHLADNTPGRENRSPLIVCQDGRLLPHAHALHDDISKTGEGRFSHWGEYVYFAPLGDVDPVVEPQRFALVSVNEAEEAGGFPGSGNSAGPTG
jgi:2-polyprenyl-6-hydroxyphenyl methylase/3-demethylubiquinone-9 3-methyltransferase